MSGNSRRSGLDGRPQAVNGQDAQLPPPAPNQITSGPPSDATATPDAAAVNELTEAVTSLPAGATSHHFAPNPSLPCPWAAL
jgi:hypothetical protein